MFDDWELIRKISFEIDPMSLLLSLVALGLGIWNRVGLWKQENKDWRRKYLCERLDELCDKAYSYWTTDGSTKGAKASTNRLAVDLKMLLLDIEQQSGVLKIDLGFHIKDLKEAVTGGTFEEKDRKAVGVDDDKYKLIQRASHEIRDRLMRVE